MAQHAPAPIGAPLLRTGVAADERSSGRSSTATIDQRAQLLAALRETLGDNDAEDEEFGLAVATSKAGMPSPPVQIASMTTEEDSNGVADQSFSEALHQVDSGLDARQKLIDALKAQLCKDSALPKSAPPHPAVSELLPPWSASFAADLLPQPGPASKRPRLAEGAGDRDVHASHFGMPAAPAYMQPINRNYAPPTPQLWGTPLADVPSGPLPGTVGKAAPQRPPPRRDEGDEQAAAAILLAARKEEMLRSLQLSPAGASTVPAASSSSYSAPATSLGSGMSGITPASAAAAAVVVAVPPTAADFSSAEAQKNSPEYEAYRQKCWKDYYERAGLWQKYYEQAKQPTGAPPHKGSSSEKGKSFQPPPLGKGLGLPPTVSAGGAPVALAVAGAGAGAGGVAAPPPTLQQLAGLNNPNASSQAHVASLAGARDAIVAALSGGARPNAATLAGVNASLAALGVMLPNVPGAPLANHAVHAAKGLRPMMGKGASVALAPSFGKGGPSPQVTAKQFEDDIHSALLGLT